MPSITISLWKSDTKLWDESPKPRPLRYLPDGRVGVVYRGCVYPLRGQNEVDIDDDWEDPTDCPLVPETVDVSQPWYLDTTGKTAYLVWRGRRGQVQAVIDALTEAGIKVGKDGPSTRPASNGIHYDWWVILPGGDDLSEHDLQEALDPVFAGAPDEQTDGSENISPDMVTVSAEEWQRLIRQITDITADNSKLAAKIKRRVKEEVAKSKIAVENARQAQEQLAGEKKRFQETIANHEVERRTHEHEIAAKDKELAASRLLASAKAGSTASQELTRAEAAKLEAIQERDRMSSELDRATKELAAQKAKHENCDALINETDAENIQLKEAAGSRDQALADAQARSTNHERTASYWRIQAHAAHPAITQSTLLLRHVIGVFTPTIQMVRDIEPIVASFTNLQSLLTTLREIEGGTLKGEHVEQSNGWLERHFSTGSKDDGRVYWRRHGGRIYVLVGDKESQATDINTMRRWRPPA